MSGHRKWSEITGPMTPERRARVDAVAAEVRRQEALICTVPICGHPQGEHYTYVLNGHDQTRCRACDPHTGRRMPGLYAMDSDSHEAAMFVAADHDFVAVTVAVDERAGDEDRA